MQPAGQGAERRQHDALRGDREAAPDDAAAADAHGHLGVIMAGNLGRRRALHRRVAQRDAADQHLVRHAPAERPGAVAVVVAGDPQPVDRSDQPGQCHPRRRRQASGTAAVVERVAQAPDPCRAGRGDLGGEQVERVEAVIRRQELAVDAVIGRFFEMQVGDQQRVERGPEQRTRGERHERVTGERKGNIGASGGYSAAAGRTQAVARSAT